MQYNSKKVLGLSGNHNDFYSHTIGACMVKNIHFEFAAFICSFVYPSLAIKQKNETHVRKGTKKSVHQINQRTRTNEHFASLSQIVKLAWEEKFPMH